MQYQGDVMLHLGDDLPENNAYMEINLSLTWNRCQSNLCYNQGAHTIRVDVRCYRAAVAQKHLRCHPEASQALVIYGSYIMLATWATLKQ